MNGPQHYLEAERLLGLVESGEWVDTDLPGPGPVVISMLISTAQVHATLALAAATIAPRDTWSDADRNYSATRCSDSAWNEVTP